MSPLWLFAALLGVSALVAAAFALRAHHRSKIELAKWKRRAERTHQFYTNMRRIYPQQQ